MKIFMVSSLVFYLMLTTSNLFCDGSKILVVFPFSSKSHHYFIQPILKELAKRGHEVTYYTPTPIGKNITNIKEVYLSDPVKSLFGAGFSFDMIQKISRQQYLGFPRSIFMSLAISRVVLKNPVIKELISSDEKYDIVLSELFFGQEPLVALGHKFNAPVVAVQPFTNTYSSNEFVGNPMGTAYIPCVDVPYTDEMTFFQRLHNSVRMIMMHFTSYLYYYPMQERLMRETFVYPGSEKMPPMTDMLQELSLVIINSQTAVDYVKPLVPNVIPVAGTHISSHRQPLPKDLKKFMDESKNGVVYFSFGSVVPSEQMPDDLKRTFIKVFSKVKQNVLWKLPDDKLTGLPKNLKISKWLPQHEILAHPNCIAFITHGGLLSHEEAVYFGVPFIGIPFFGDQPINVNRAVKRGFGINLNLQNVTEESLTWALNEILHKKSYQENIKTYSKVFHDNPLPPSETAAYWIEYVLRHNGAPHLRSEGRKLPYYKYLLLDVVALIITILILTTFISYKIVKLLLCKFCSKSCKQKVKSDKKNN